MNTNQDTTLTSQDVMLDLYKIHAYIPNDAAGNPLTAFGNFCEGYEVATKASESEINSLKNRVEELELTVKKWQENSVDLEYKCLDKNLLNAELIAYNIKMREELENTLTSLEESQEKECRCDYTR